MIEVNKMAKIHARVTMELEIPDEEMIRLVEANRLRKDDLCDVDLDCREGSIKSERFWKDGCVSSVDFSDDTGYIPSNWLLADALDSGLYEYNNWNTRTELRRKQ